MGVYTVKELERTDAAAVAALHMKAFRNFFLSSLGKAFLNVFYAAIIRHPMGICLGIKEEGNILGFTVGSYTNRGFYKSLLKRHFFSFAIQAFPKLILKPQKTFRIISNFVSPHINITDEGAVLLSICVDPLKQGSGIGQLLMGAFEDKVAGKGIKRVFLTTDAVNNDAVNRFYTKNAYTLYDSCRTSYGRDMNVYIKNLLK
jgi:GNAT superfamily N-acetyltransferase